MAPEQARGIEVDHRADLWSLGVIIYKALSGRLPFTGRTPTSVIVKVCTCDPQPISELAPDLPRELDAFFRRALAREPEQRFASARELALAFSRITPITFTTLSMPDPKEIEAAIASARAAAAADDDNLETLAVDAASFDALQRLQDPHADDLKTSLHIPASLGLATKLAALPIRKSTLPQPKLPKKRRATDGPPSSASAVLAPSSAAGPPPPPSRPMRLPPPLSGRGAPRPPDSQDELPTAASMPFLDAPPESATSAPMLLSRAGALAADDLFGPEPISEPSVSAPLRPSTPTLRGIGEHDSTPPPPRHTRPTLLMAAAAVLVGVLVAVIGSAVKSESEPVAGQQVRASHGLPQANGSADVAARGDGAENEHAAESSAADADDAQSDAAEPNAAESNAAKSNAATVAKSGAPHRAKRPGASGKAPPSTASKAAAAKSEPPKSEPPKSEPPKGESKPDKAPPNAGADPFAERL
jgi:serine/threonine-protein kinase